MEGQASVVPEFTGPLGAVTPKLDEFLKSPRNSSSLGDLRDCTEEKPCKWEKNRARWDLLKHTDMMCVV